MPLTFTVDLTQTLGSSGAFVTPDTYYKGALAYVPGVFAGDVKPMKMAVADQGTLTVYSGGKFASNKDNIAIGLLVYGTANNVAGKFATAPTLGTGSFDPASQIVMARRFYGVVFQSTPLVPPFGGSSSNYQFWS